MPQALVLLNADSGSLDAVVTLIKGLPGVSEVYKLHGVYDIIAKVNANSEEDLRVKVRALRLLDKVTASLSLLVSTD